MGFRRSNGLDSCSGKGGSVRISAAKHAIVTEDFRDFPQFFQAYAGVVS